MTTTRRRLLKLAGGVIVSFSLTACATRRPKTRVVQTEGARSALFPQGVGSADPHPNSVMLWTRVETEQPDEVVRLILQISQNKQFGSIVLETEITASDQSDFTVRAFVDGLQPDTVYYYRFITPEGISSRTGRTWTAPDHETDREVRIAYACCQNFGFGFFGGYRRLMKDHGALESGRPQLDFILHLGDYIYENEGANPERGLPDRFGGLRKLGRLPSGGEIGFRNQQVASTLDDYRFLYKRYLSDPDFQAARALFPFVCVWDDHEFADDAWQTVNDGRRQSTRRMNALQAWFEFVPTNLSRSGSIEGVDNQAYDFAAPTTELAETEDWHFDEDFQATDTASRSVIDSMCIYRSLRWGRNVDLILTDQRSYKGLPASLAESLEPLTGPPNPDISSMELSEANAMILAQGYAANEKQPPVQLSVRGQIVDNPRVNTPPATVLGAKQKSWFKNCLARSSARWKVWGSSSPLMRFGVDLSFLDGKPGIGALWLEDTWDGFPNERSELMSYIRDEGITDVISLSGDRHLHAAGLVKINHEEPASPAVMPDFAVGSLAMASRANSQEPVFAQMGHPGFAVTKPRSSEDLRRSVPTLNLLLRRSAADVKSYLETGLVGPEHSAAKSTNPHLSFLDAMINGYALARFTASHAEVTFIGLNPADVRKDWGTDGPPVHYRAGFKVDRWRPGESPSIERQSVVGANVFGDEIAS